MHDVFIHNQVALLSFGEVINRLCRGTQSDTGDSDNNQGIHEVKTS